MTTSKQGRRPTTIYSVAQLAGVSIATVSRVLQGTKGTSPQTRANVLRAVEKLDYVPLQAARSLAVHRHEAHGFILPDLIGPYYSELLMGYESAAAELGQSVVIVVARPSEEATRAVQLSSRVDGIVVANSAISDDAAVSRCHGGAVRLGRGGHHSDRESGFPRTLGCRRSRTSSQPAHNARRLGLRKRRACRGDDEGSAARRNPHPVRHRGRWLGRRHDGPLCQPQPDHCSSAAV